MKDLKSLTNDELLALYKMVNEYIEYLEKEKSNTDEQGEVDAK